MDEWLLYEHDFPDFAVRIYERKMKHQKMWGRWLHVTITQYGTDDCRYCDGGGCHECNYSGIERIHSGKFAFSKEETESMGRQYLALYLRYGRVDVDSVADFLTGLPQHDPNP